MSPSSWCHVGRGHPRTCTWYPLGPGATLGRCCSLHRPRAGQGVPCVPSRAEQHGRAGGCTCPIPGPSPCILSPTMSLLVAERGRRCPQPLPRQQHHQPPPRQGPWVPGSSQNPGPNLAQGPRAEQRNRRQLEGPSSCPPCHGGPGLGRGTPHWGSVGAKHPQDGSARSATHSPFPPRSPLHPRFRDMPGKGPPAPALASAVQ